jgi:hypothetical protein
MNRKLTAYLDQVDYYVTDITRDIMNGEQTYPVACQDDEGSFLRFPALPSPQRVGTETQKRDYARMKALEIVERIKGYGAEGPLDYATFEVKA